MILHFEGQKGEKNKKNSTKKIEEEGTLSNLFYVASITLNQKQRC